MDSKEQHSASENDAHRPLKRARHSPPPTSTQESPNRNGNGSSNGYSLPLLSLSILGVEPLDEFIREVADFVHHMITTRPEGAGQVEVEAKIGVLRDKLSGQRVQLPVLVETSTVLFSPFLKPCSRCEVLVPNSIDSRFESNMSPIQHKHFNTLLNNLKTSSSTPSPLEYAHLRLVDSFYSPDGASRSDRIRVTRDEKSGTVHACMRKVRLGDLDVYSPKRAADWRISVSMEIPGKL
ncbi:hypothetical protein AcV5_007399 [Taiwanofungus camphoratus]|nr:hypothetical protein AcV5_007399 [Antrodia cinnamomea]